MNKSNLGDMLARLDMRNNGLSKNIVKHDFNFNTHFCENCGISQELYEFYDGRVSCKKVFVKKL